MKRNKLFILLAILLISFSFLLSHHNAKAGTSSTASGGTTYTPSTTPAKPAPHIVIAVSGRVYDADTKKPIAGASVSVSGGSFNGSSITDMRGNYTITGCPSNQSLAISCRRAGYRGYSSVLPGSSTSLSRDISLSNLMGSNIDAREPGDSSGEEAVTPDTGYYSGLEDYEPEPRTIKKVEPEDERLVQAVLAGPGVDVEVERFIINRLNVDDNPVIFSLEPENEEYNVSMSIKNNSQDPVEQVPVTFMVDGEAESNFTIPIIESDASVGLASIITLAEGRHDLEVIADHPSDIDDSNDVMRGIVTIREGPDPVADLLVTDFTIDGQDIRLNPVLPQGNGGHDIAISYRNDGPTGLENIELRISEEGDGVIEEERPPLAAGADDEFNRAGVPFELGAHDLLLVMFARMDHEDPDQNNNLRSGTVTFEEGDRVVPPQEDEEEDVEPPQEDEEEPAQEDEEPVEEIPEIDLEVRRFFIDNVDVSTNPDIPHKNGQHRVALHVLNNGPDTARDVQVILWRRDDDDMWFEQRDLRGGEAYPFDMLELEFPAGRNDLSVTVSAAVPHREANMDNNRIRGIVNFREAQPGDNEMDPDERDGRDGEDPDQIDPDEEDPDGRDEGDEVDPDQVDPDQGDGGDGVDPDQGDGGDEVDPDQGDGEEVDGEDVDRVDPNRDDLEEDEIDDIVPPAGDEAPPVAPDADVIQMPVVPPGGPDGAGVMDLSPQESSGSVKGPSLLDIAMKAEGIKRLPVPVLPEDAPLAKRWLWWLLLLIYLYFALSLHAISRKTKTARVWLSWIPLANIYQMCKIAGKPAKWCWLFLIPLANIVVAVIVWMNIAKAVNKPSWIGILLIIPIVNILLPGYLALSK